MSAITRAASPASTAKRRRKLQAGRNFIVAAVDDTRLADGVPTTSTDWFNYGGLTRDVSLVDLPESFIDDYDLHLNRERTAIVGWVHVQKATAGESVTVSIPEAQRSATVHLDGEGKGKVNLSASGLQLWSPEQPKLYRVLFTADADRLEDLMGFRTIETEGTKILLNGKPIFLRGISIHAEAPRRGGRANNDKDVETLLGWAQELGCNYVRLAHYPHDQRMTRATDRMGILVWSEIPGLLGRAFRRSCGTQKGAAAIQRRNSPRSEQGFDHSLVGR